MGLKYVVTISLKRLYSLFKSTTEKHNIDWFLGMAIIFPILFYGSIFWGKSFGFDCAPAVMGNYPPYEQELTFPNRYCASIIDPGAYVWTHPSEIMEVARQLSRADIATWTSNMGIGMPLLANFQSNALNIVMYPFSILFFFLGKNLIFFDLFFLFRYVLLSAGMYLFLRSLKVGKGASLFGSFVFFNVGYFVFIPNILHHNVDILLPFIAWGINKLYFTGNKKWIAATGLLLGLSMLGGMPESSIFVLFFTGVYITFLSFFFLKEQKWKYFMYGILAIVLGLGIGAIVYLPGLELIANGASSHHAGGNQKFVDWRNVVLFVMPELFAGNYGYQYSGKLDFNMSSWNYIGTTVGYLYLLLTGHVLGVIKRVRIDRRVVFLVFFWLLTLILLLQQFGILHFYLFEKLPVFKQTQFTKYSSSLISFLMVTSVTLFLEFTSKRRPKKTVLYWLITAGLIIYVNYHYLAVIIENQYLKKYFGMLSPNVLYALVLVTVVTALFVFIRSKKIRLGMILILVFVEFYIYLPKDGDQVRRDSLRQPPAINFLLGKNYKEYRIFGLDNILYPNLATVYDLNDVRLLDALWIDRYYQYMKNFFAEPDAFRITGIRENSATRSANIVSNPYFDMLSVKYLLSYYKIETEILDNSLIDDAVKQNPKAANLAKTIFDINNDAKQVLFEHAPNDISVTFSKPVGANYLMIYPALSPNLFGQKNGNGVLFRAELYQGQRMIFSKEEKINSSNMPGDEKWFEFKIGPFVGDGLGKYRLRLMTDTLGNDAYDWSGWGGFVWDNELNETIDKYKLVYDNEMKIYESKDYIPRLHFVGQKICVPDRESSNDLSQDKYSNIVSLMKQHQEGITKMAIIDGKDCGVSRYNPKVATISNQVFEDREISFSYSSDEKQYVVLSDAYYPGWNVYIDYEKGEIEPANLAFKGFELPAGKDLKVRLRYEPLVYRLGAIISVSSLIISLFIFVRNGKKRDKSNKEE